MGEGIVKGFSSRRFRYSILIFILVACAGIIMSPTDLTIMKNMPLISHLHQITKNVMEGFSIILQSNPILVALLIPIMLLAYYKIGRKSVDDSTSRYYKPRKTSKVDSPSEQIVKIVALAPQSYFNKFIEKLYREMSDIYGNIPLWIRYDVDVLANSWSLNNVKASHTIYAYGESTCVQKFVSRLNEKLQILMNNALLNAIRIYSVETTSSNLNKHGENNIQQLYPKEIKNLMPKDNNASLFSGLGLLSTVILTMLANDLWRRRKASPNADENSMGEVEAMQSALKVVREFGGKNQELEKIEDCGDGWTFKFTEYEVFVNRSGLITHMRRCN